MKTFEQLRRYIKENIPDPFDTKKGEGPDFEKELKKTKSKGIKTCLLYTSPSPRDEL